MVETKPTVGRAQLIPGFNLEEIELLNTDFLFYDAGGATTLQRTQWKKGFISSPEDYLGNVDAIFFVIDGSKPQRLTEAEDELEGMVSLMLSFVGRSSL